MTNSAMTAYSLLLEGCRCPCNCSGASNNPLGLCPRSSRAISTPLGFWLYSFPAPINGVSCSWRITISKCFCLINKQPHSIKIWLKEEKTAKTINKEGKGENAMGILPPVVIKWCADVVSWRQGDYVILCNQIWLYTLDIHQYMSCCVYNM